MNRNFITALFRADTSLLAVREIYKQGQIQEGDPDTKALQDALEVFEREVNLWLTATTLYKDFDR